MTDIVQIYDLMGHPNGERIKSEANDQMIDRRAETAFKVLSTFVFWIFSILLYKRMDLDQDGVITLDEFMTSCLEDSKMNQSFFSLDMAKNM